MALTVTTNLQTIFDCDTDGMDGGWGVLETDAAFVKEGTGCLGVDCDIETESGWYTLAGATDFTGRHYYVWLWCVTNNNLDVQANGGLQLWLADSSGNEGYWYVGGKDTYEGGWRRFCISADSTPSANNGTNPIKTAITKVGLAFKCTAKSKLAANVYWDHLAYDTAASRGIKVTGGASAPRDFEELWSKDDGLSEPAGIIQKRAGNYFIQGPIEFGDDSGILALTFEDSGAIIRAEDGFMADGHMRFEIVGNATGATSFTLGSKAGTNGIQGCYIKQDVVTWTNAEHPKLVVLSTDTNVNTLKIYGTSFIGCGAISFPVNSVTREVISCYFEDCGLVDPDTITFEQCSIVDPKNQGLRIDTASHNVKNCIFIAGADACDLIMIPVSVTIGFDNLRFYNTDGATGGRYDVEHTVSGTLTINASNGSDPSDVLESGGGSTTINNAVNLKVTVLDESQQPVVTAQTSMHLLNSPFTELMNEDTVAGGIAEESYNYLGDADVVVKVRKSDDLDDPRYKPFSTVGKITSAGLPITVILRKEGIPI